MTRKSDPSDIEKLECRLASLMPVENEELAVRILARLEEKKLPVLDSVLESGQFLPGANTPTQHASCMASTLPMLTGIVGGIVGAALMFLVMTAYASPKVEIREVVRYVPVEVSAPVSTNHAETEARPVEPVEKQESPETKEKTQQPGLKTKPQVQRELPWFLAMLRPLAAIESNASLIATNNPCDIDAMLERRNEIARQARFSEPRPQLIRYQPSNDPPSDFSPVMYRQMIENFNL